MRGNLLKALCAFVLLGASVAHAADAYVLKFATLAPTGSTWMKAFDAWGKELAAKSQGRLVVKFYPGGISGDEPDMLRKIRFGQLQGAALSGHGIGEIFPPARILETPFLFRDHAEIDAVRAAIQPALETGFRNNQYELVAWMEVGNFTSFPPSRWRAWTSSRAAASGNGRATASSTRFSMPTAGRPWRSRSPRFTPASRPGSSIPW